MLGKTMKFIRPMALIMMLTVVVISESYCGLEIIPSSDSQINKYSAKERNKMLDLLKQTEPNVEIASRWWTDMSNVWTPVGWKNHLFRFNIFNTGIILAEPHPQTPFAKNHTSAYAGLGVQVAIIPSADGAIPAKRTEPYMITDSNANRIGRQGWSDNPTPVLWTEWRQPHFSLNGITLRQEFFGHIPGTGDVQSGIEPLFGWIRISVAEKLEFIPREKVGFVVKVNAPHIQVSMWALDNLVIAPSVSAYPGKLFVENLGTERPGCLLTEKNGKVRLAALPGKADSVRFIDRLDGEKDYYLYITMPAVKGAYVDLLLPFITTERSVVESEMALGFDTALAESDLYWSVKPKSAAVIETPEPLINSALRTVPKFAEVIAEKNPETGQYSALVGSYCYASVWATPHSMLMHMMLDPLGYHEVADRYLRIYKDTQGTSKAPGPNYPKHPGYLGAPRSLSSVDWITDHGAILHGICEHAILSGDRKFIDEYLPVILSACEFIRDARKITNHAGVNGVLPPASSTDRDVPEQSVWADGWNYKGLTSAVKLLKIISHPRAKEFEQEAADYKKKFCAAYIQKIKTTPVWKDAGGNSHPLVPTSFINGDDNHPFHLDGGPLFLVYSGLLDADDEIMRDILLYFREGPNTRTFDPMGNFHQPAVLVHEISSCEPCYSWNVFHSWQTGDRMKYLEGMYSLLTGGMSRQTHISSEHRGGISGTQFVAGLAVYLVRLAAIDDKIENNSLHLLRLAPLAWVTSEMKTQFLNMPTEFGPISVSFQLSEDMKTLTVDIDADFRRKPDKVVLHIPPVKEIKRAVINGKSTSVKPWDTISVSDI